MAFVAGKRRVKEGVDDLERKPCAHHSCAHRKNVCVVMQPRRLGGEAVAAKRRSYAGDLVCGDGYSDTRTADQNASVAVAVRYRMGDRLSVNGIVAAILRVGAEVLIFKSTLGKVLHYLLLECIAAVVTTDRNHFTVRLFFYNVVLSHVFPIMASTNTGLPGSPVSKFTYSSKLRRGFRLQRCLRRRRESALRCA